LLTSMLISPMRAMGTSSSTSRVGMMARILVPYRAKDACAFLLSIYLAVTSRPICRGRFSLWRHLFPALHPMLQRKQRRYHVKSRRPDNLCGMKQFCEVVFSTDFHTLHCECTFKSKLDGISRETSALLHQTVRLLPSHHFTSKVESHKRTQFYYTASVGEKEKKSPVHQIVMIRLLLF
jgi:hypothetical protein